MGDDRCCFSSLFNETHFLLIVNSFASGATVGFRLSFLLLLAAFLFFLNDSNSVG